jgi:putative ABC transport system permease protein
MLVNGNGHCLFKTIARMFSSFFKLALRIFFRDRVHTLINIFGLAIGLSFSIIIFLYVHKEISYDRFHDNSKRIYRVAVRGKIADNVFNHAVTPAPLARTMIREIPEVESTVRVARFGAWLVRYRDARYNEDNIIFADPTFFQIFSFPLIKGKSDEVLRKPNSIVISRLTAQRYFGDEYPIGKMLRIENDSAYYEVTGIMENVPENSHMHFDMVGTLSTFDKLLGDDRWIAHYLYTYILAKPGASVDEIKAGLGQIVSDFVLPDYRKLLNINGLKDVTQNDYYNFIIQPLTDIHLKSEYSAEFEPTGKILYVHLFTALAIIILILSCMNFISLVTAQSQFRAKEVSIRKIAGSERRILIRQFLLESSLLAFFAMALALLFTELALPAFSRYIGLHLGLGLLLNTAGIILMVTLLLIIGLLSGLYPAWHLSSYNPTAVMRNRFNNQSGKALFRTGLALFQLFIAVGAVTMTLIINFQFRYLVNKDRGYDTKNLVVIRRPDGLTNKLEDYKKQVRQHPGVLSVTNTTSAMGGSFTRNPYYLEGNAVNKNYAAANLLVSYGFDSTYRINLSAGRFFLRSVPADSSACVINETAARLMGITDPVGKTLIRLTAKPDKRFKFKIIGVVKDFHFETLENEIRPLVMVLMPGNFEGYLTVRLTPDNQEATIQYMKTVWEGFTAAYPFVYYFLDKDKHEHYSPVQETGRIFSLLSVVTILMAGLGLFALVSFSYSRRQREIGIQKAMGASNLSIILHKAVEIVTMVMIASLAAWTGVYFLANAWFDDYAYHVNMNILFFLSATVIVTLFSLITVYYHTCLAARTNPGKALKYE